jgi:hypothetical protein
MDTLFNEQLKNPKGLYLRYGVHQNRSSILNVFFMIARRFHSFVSKQQFEEYLFSHLTDELYKTLNGGFILNTFGPLDDFKFYLKNPNKNIRWSEVVDLMYKIFKINTLVFDIPFFDKTNNIDIENIKLLCNWYIQNDIKKSFRDNENFVIILKRRETYEIVCLKNDEDDSFELVFNKSDKILQYCIEYYSDTCQILEEFPEEYKTKYSIYRISVNYLINRLKGSEFEVKSLVVNSFNQVNYIQLNNNALLLVKESGIVENLPVIDLDKIDLITLPTFIEYKDLITKVNKYLDEEYHYKIIGLLQNDNKQTNAVMMNMNYLVPIKESEYKSTDLPILDIKYNHNPDKVINSKDVDTSRMDYIKGSKQLEKDILTTKVHLGKVFAIDDLQNDNIILVKNLKGKVKELIPRSEKFNYIYNTLYKIILQLQKREQESYENDNITYEQMTLNLEKNKMMFVLHHIANEIINDTNEQLLLNNVIISRNEKEKKFVERSTEVVFDEIYEFLDWVKNKYSINEE